MESISPPVTQQGDPDIHHPYTQGTTEEETDCFFGLTAAPNLLPRGDSLLLLCWLVFFPIPLSAVFGASHTARTGDPATPTTPSHLLLPELGHSPSFSVGLPTRR